MARRIPDREDIGNRLPPSPRILCARNDGGCRRNLKSSDEAVDTGFS